MVPLTESLTPSNRQSLMGSAMTLTSPVTGFMATSHESRSQITPLSHPASGCVSPQRRGEVRGGDKTTATVWGAVRGTICQSARMGAVEQVDISLG